jgi:hypothetical protein
VNRSRIRELNDAFRTSLSGGQVYTTPGVRALHALPAIVERVRSYGAFDQGNDPHGEHDFGAFDHRGHRIFWKIDYYDRTLKWGSSDPADPAVTTRVLTIFLASEY